MADSKLVISIEDDSPPPPPTAGASPPPLPPPLPPLPPMLPAGSMPTGASAGSVPPTASAAAASPVGSVPQPLFPPVTPAGSVPPPTAPPAGSKPTADDEWEAAKERARTNPSKVFEQEDQLEQLRILRRKKTAQQEEIREAEAAARKEIQERAKEARRITAEYEAERAEREIAEKKIAKEKERLDKEEADWQAARGTARKTIDKEREQEGQLKEIAGSREGREQAESKTKARAEWIGRQAAQMGYVGQRIGQVTEGMAGNRAAPAVDAGIEVAVAGLSKLGPYGKAAGVALEAVGKVGHAASDAVQAFVNRGKELAHFNGTLANSTANADIRSLMADFREANDIGGQMARLIENQSKGDAAMRELMLPIKDFILDHLNRAIELGLPFMADVLELLNGILSGVTFGLGKSDALTATVAKIRDIIADKDGGADLMASWLEGADRLPARGIAPVPAAGNLGIPLLMRKP